MTLAAALTFTAAAAAHSQPFAGGPPAARVAFLEQRLAHHRYVCSHGGPFAGTRWHCKAVRWTGRELRQAEADLERYDNAVPAWPWQALARCEQRGNGVHGVNWTAYSETYEGAYGFVHSTWDRYRYPGMPHSANLATPREQTRVARRLVVVFGGYSSWPTCHIRLGLPG